MMKRLLFFLFAIILAIQGWAQFVTIGTGTTGKYDMPINTYYNHSYTQQIFTAAEIGTQVGVINSLSFQYIYSTPQVKNPVTIYIGNTTKNTFTSTTNWVPIDSMAEVFTGSVNFTNTATGNWVNIIFDSPFIWDGTSNIVVAVVNNHGSYSTSSNNTFNTHSTTDNKGLRYEVDGTVKLNPALSTYTGTLCNYRANIQLEFGTAPTCLTPGSLTYKNVTHNSIDISWIKKGTAQLWDVEYKLTSDTSWLNSTTTIATDSTISLTNLLPNTNYDFRVRSNCGGVDVSLWRTGNFTTLCTPTITLPITENFDNLGGSGAAYYPSCWSRITTYSTYPYSTTTNHSGPYSLYLYATTGNYNLAILNGIDQSINVNTLEVSFWMRKGSATSDLIVGVMSDPKDPTSFVGIDTVAPSATVVWEPFDVSLASYTGTGKHIAFLEKGVSATNYSYLDDVVVDYIPSCAKPTNITFTNITPTSATVSWTPGSVNDIAWWVYHRPAGTTKWDSVYTTTNTYSFSSLSPSASYDVEIKTDCGTGLSKPSYTKVLLTSCGLISSIPWSQTFDSYGTGSTALPTCWGRKTTYSNYPYISTTAYSSPGAMYFYATSGNYNISIFPGLDQNINLNNLTLFFKLYKGSAAYNITIGVMSDTANVTTFDSIINLSPSTTSTWENFSVNFSSYIGTGRYIALKCYGLGATNAMYVDNIILDYSPPCSTPKGLTMIDSLQTLNSMTFDWDGTDDANVLSWKVEYKPYDDAIWSDTTVFVHPVTLPNLQSSVVYQVKVSATCSNGYITYPTTIKNYGMPCATINTFPWTEGFEKVWFVAAGINTGTHPWCWTNIDGGASTSYNWRKTTSTSYVRSGSGALQMYAANTTASLSDWIISPTLTLTGNERLQFWAKGYSTYTDDLSVRILDVTTNGVVDTVSDTNLFTIIMPNTIVSSNDWTQFEISLSQYIGDYQIAFVRNTTGGYYLNIDDISVSPMPPCARPTIITFPSVLATSADISWTPANAADNAWWVYYKQASSSTWDSVYTTTYPITINNLIPNTNYNVQVKTDCGIIKSLPSIAASFKTSCLAISSIPYTENFDAYGTGTGTYPSCWTKFSQYSTTYPYINTTYFSSPGALYFYSYNNQQTYAILGAIDSTISMDTLRVMFKMYYTSLNYHNLQVGVMTDPNDITTFVPIDNVQSVTAASVWQDKEVSLASYTGTGRYIAFKTVAPASTYNYGYMDNVVVDYIPACAKPTNLATSNITTTSANISWTNGNVNNSSWWLYYKPNTSTTYDSIQITSQSPFTLTNLAISTLYDYYMRTNCITELSEPTTVYSFRTACASISTLPWSDSFDTYGTGTYIFPSCWTRNTTYADRPYVSSTNFSAPGSLYFYAGTAGTYNIAATPMIDTSILINTLRVNFKYRNTYATDTLKIGVMVDPLDASTWVEVDKIFAPTTATWGDYEISLAPYTGIGRYIALRADYGSTYTYAYVDNLVISYIPACAKPTQLKISNITTTSAELSWTNGNPNDASWWLFTKLASATTYDSVLISTASPFTILNLLPSSPYNYYMKTNCTTDISEPTSVYSFYTACAPLSTFPWYEGFEADWLPTSGVSNDAYPSCWININGGASATYKWRKTTSTGIGYIRTGSGSAQLYGANQSMGDYLITPTFTLDGNQRIIFWAKGYSSSTNYPENIWLKAFNETTNGAFDTISDTTLMTNIAFINDTNQYTWKEYEFPLTGLVGNYRLAFARNNSVGYYFHIDDLKVDNLAACPRPITTSVSNIQQTQADISWTPGTVTDNAWKIFYRPIGSPTWDSVYTASNPYTLTNLIPSTNYEVEIKTDCGTGAFSDGRSVTFMTLCGAMAIPTAIESFVTVLPNTCWSRFTGQLPTTGSATLSTSTGNWIANTQVTPHNIKANLYSTSQYYWLVTPSIDLGSGSLSNHIEFDVFLTAYANANVPNLSSGYADKKFYVLISTDNGLTWTATKTLRKWDNAGSVDTLNKLTNVPLHVSIPIVDSANNPYSGVVKFAFYGESTVSSVGDNDLHIDNFQVTGFVCASPTSLATTGITQTTATVNWTAGGSETSWEVKLGAAGATTMVTSPTYTFTGLTTATQYTAYVRANCGTSNSAWVPVTFTTSSAPIIAVVTTAPVTTFTYNTASFVGSYTTGADTINAVGFEYKTTAATAWTNQSVSPVASPFSYNTTGLTPSTQYKVRAYVTKQGGVNVYGDTMTFTTAVFNAPTVTTDPVTNLTGTTATFNGTVAQGTESIVSRGFEYKTSAQAWTSAFEVTATGSTTITANVTGLVTGTNYDVRAYAETATGKTYGSILTFIPSNGVVVGEVSTQSASLVAATTATLNGTLVNVGGATTGIEVGFVYSTTTNPEINGANVIKVPVSYTTGMTTYNSNITGLTPVTQYYVKSYITNSAGTAYGQQITFTTLSGLNDIDVNAMSVSLYPNPASTTSTLVVKGIVGLANVVITDVQGRTINTFEVKSVNGEATKSINVNSFAKGVYYVRIQNANTTRTQKLIVE